jgi:hypothetical protein
MIFSETQQLLGSNTQPNARPAVIFGNEFDAGLFEWPARMAAPNRSAPQTGDVEFNPLSLCFVTTRHGRRN